MCSKNVVLLAYLTIQLKCATLYYIVASIKTLETLKIIYTLMYILSLKILLIIFIVFSILFIILDVVDLVKSIVNVHTRNKVFPGLHWQRDFTGNVTQTVQAGVQVLTCFSVFQCRFIVRQSFIAAATTNFRFLTIFQLENSKPLGALFAPLATQPLTTR